MTASPAPTTRRPRPTVVSVPGYRITIEPSGQCRTEPRRDSGTYHGIRCLTCGHLKGFNLEISGRRFSCRLGRWREPDGRPIYLGTWRVHTPPPAVRKAAEACIDHTPQEGA